MISKKLKELRERRGLNKKQTANLFGMKYTTYIGYENGTREPNSEALILFSKEYKVSVDYLLGRKKGGATNDIDDSVHYLYERDDIKLLINAAKTATKEDIETAIKIIIGLRNERERRDN